MSRRTGRFYRHFKRYNNVYAYFHGKSLDGRQVHVDRYRIRQTGSVKKCTPEQGFANRNFRNFFDRLWLCMKWFLLSGDYRKKLREFRLRMPGLEYSIMIDLKQYQIRQTRPVQILQTRNSQNEISAIFSGSRRLIRTILG